MSGLRVLFDRDIAAARVVALLIDTSGNVVRELSAPMRRGCESEIRNELRASLRNTSHNFDNNGEAG